MPATRLARRVIARLAQAEVQELNPHYRDDLRIARLTVAYAASGEAVLCSPHVLASYMVLGLHPDRVWPAIQERRAALGINEKFWGWNLPPKKPPVSAVVRSQQKLWVEKTSGADHHIRAADSNDLRDHTISVPMAAPSIAALFPKSEQSSSAKKREYTYDDLLLIVRKSYAPPSVVAATINALTARGKWPKYDGPVSRILCVSLEGMMLGGKDGDRNVVRSTARWRARRAVQLGYWRLVRKPNSWSNCPECGAERRRHKLDCTCGHCPLHAGKCEKCKYEGSAKTPDGKANFNEFCRPYMYELDIEKFQSALPAKGIRHFDHRTYQEHKAAAKRGEHPNVVDMASRKPAQPAPEPPPPPAAAPVRQPAAEHSHRDTTRPRTVVNAEISVRSTKAAELLMEMCGLADMGAIPQIAISIAAEAKYRGVEIEDAAKFIAECATRDQKNGVVLNRFYFRDLKWRGNGGRQTSAATDRAEHNKRSILNGFARNARDSSPSDGAEREDHAGRGGPADG